MAISLLTKLGIHIEDIFSPMLDGKFGVNIKITEQFILFSKSGSHVTVTIEQSKLLHILDGPCSSISIITPQAQELYDQVNDALVQLAADTNSGKKTVSDLKLDEPEGNGVFVIDNSAVETPAPSTGPVLLRDATELYQRVYGTSSGSVYLVVALSSDLRIAVRAQTSKVSVRVEGDVGKYKKALTEAGLSVKTEANPYASIHLGASNPQLARRTIGAMLMAIDAKWDTQMPDFDKLYEKGTG